jgi:hypothetical protein
MTPLVLEFVEHIYDPTPLLELVEHTTLLNLRFTKRMISPNLRLVEYKYYLTQPMVALD